MKRRIYLDNASTTPVKKEVLSAMKQYWNVNFGNPSSITKMGVLVRQSIEKARASVSSLLFRRPNEIIFTSGGTESNNLAIFGVVKNLEEKGLKISDLHFITTNIEHSSVTECFKDLERRGAKLDYLKVRENGLVDPDDLRKILKPNTVLVSVAYANNEIGTVQPIRDIAREVRHARKQNIILKKGADEETGIFPYLHTDSSQAGLYLNLNINELGVDLMTLDAQKIYGPKGAGILFKKAEIEISPIILGGGQEGNLRSGTENVPSIIGLTKAFEIARNNFEKRAKKVKEPRDYFWEKIQKEIPEVVLNGDMENRLPNNLNISIPGIDSEFTVLRLDEMGIVCSTRSACSQDENGSAVVRALGKNDDLAKSTLRFSLGEDVTKRDINFVTEKLGLIIGKQKV